MMSVNANEKHCPAVGIPGVSMPSSALTRLCCTSGYLLFCILDVFFPRKDSELAWRWAKQGFFCPASMVSRHRLIHVDGLRKLRVIQLHNSQPTFRVDLDTAVP